MMRIMLLVSKVCALLKKNIGKGCLKRYTKSLLGGIPASSVKQLVSQSWLTRGREE